MAEMKRVRLADMRPDPRNPRRDFGDLDALAASFAYTPGRPGEPVSPPIVVRDANVYRIVDGERRYRAMCKAGTPDSMCECVVFEDYGEASRCAAMMATDDKERLTDEERCMGIQQMLILGTPEEEVEAVARMKKGEAARARRAIGSADKPVPMSLDYLFEVASVDDDSRREELVRLAFEDERKDWSGEFRTKLRRYRGYERAVRTRDEFAGAVSAFGLETVSEEPDAEEWKYVATFWNADTLSITVGEHPGGPSSLIMYLPDVEEPAEGVSYPSVSARLYSMRCDGEDEEAAEREAERIRREAFDAAVDEDAGRRAEFIMRIVRDGSILEASGAEGMVCMRDLLKESVGEFFCENKRLFEPVRERTGLNFAVSELGEVEAFEEWSLPIMLLHLEPSRYGLFELCDRGDGSDLTSAAAARWADHLESFARAGYPLSEAEREIAMQATGTAWDELSAEWGCADRPFS